MLYPDIHLAIPDGARYERFSPRKGETYLRYRVRSFHDQNGKKKHVRVCIGKIIKDAETGVEYLCPNKDYYTKLMNLPLPVAAVVKSRGKTASVKHPASVTYSELSESVGFGYMIACWSIVKELGLDSLLEQCFGSLAPSIIVAGAFFAAGAPGGLTNIDHFTRKNMCFTNKVMGSDDLCELYSNMPQSMRNEFFMKWIKRCCENDFVCYDVTSISNYSERLPFVAWGYNRDKEPLQQFNVGMFCTIKSQMPVYFCQYNGNINDFTNFPYVAKQAKDIGLGTSAKITLVIDGGFAVPETIAEAVDCGFDLIVGAPCDFGVNVKDSILQWRSSVLADKDVILLDNEAVRYCEQPFTIGRVNSRLMMFKLPSSTLTQEASLVALINRMEAELSERKRMSKAGMEKYMPFFKFALHDDGSFSFERDQYILHQALLMCGCFAIFCTRDDLDCEQVLIIYRAKDCIEKAFAMLKNDILDERVRTKSLESTNGKLFLAFIGLIIRKCLDRKLRTYLSKRRIGLDSAIDRLADIRCRRTEGSWVLEKAMTKQQKELVEVLQLPVGYLT